jgi:hypothetical protein
MEKTMEQKILKAMNGKMTMVEIINKASWREYTKEVQHTVNEMVEKGTLTRTWDESGMTFYEVA